GSHAAAPAVSASVATESGAGAAPAAAPGLALPAGQTACWPAGIPAPHASVAPEQLQLHGLPQQQGRPGGQFQPVAAAGTGAAQQQLSLPDAVLPDGPAAPSSAVDG